MNPTTFAELKAWLAQYPDQHNGSTSYLSQTGEPYMEFLSGAPYRPGDEDIAKAMVCETLCLNLRSYLESRSGPVYWQIPLEQDDILYSWVISYDPNGPDKDFITDKKCFMDRNWRAYKLYCRVLRSDKPMLPTQEASAFAAMKVLDHGR